MGVPLPNFLRPESYSSAGIKSQYSRWFRDEHYLKHIDTTYLAQKIDLYVHMFTRLHWIWKGVGVSNNRVHFPFFNGLAMNIFNFLSVEPINKYIYILYVNRTHLYVRTCWAFKQRWLIKFINHFGDIMKVMNMHLSDSVIN